MLTPTNFTIDNTSDKENELVLDSIPIKNLYHILSYVLDHKLNPINRNKIALDKDYSLLDLFSKLLVVELAILPNEVYINNIQNEILSGVKGKINFNDTINRSLLNNAKIACVYDDFDVDIIHNKFLNLLYC